MNLFHLFFHPHFVLKYYLFRDIASLTQQVQFKGKLLDVGCGSKPYQPLFPFLSSYEGIDFHTFSRNKEFGERTPDYFFSDSYKKTSDLPFSANSYDIISAFQVIEHHPNPTYLITEMARVVKKNGYLIFSFPFLSALHEEPNDFQRITPYGIQKVLKNNHCKILYLKTQGSIFSTALYLWIDFCIEQSQKSLLHAIMYKSIFPFFFSLSLFSFLIDPLLQSKKICLNYLVLAKKSL